MTSPVIVPDRLATQLALDVLTCLQTTLATDPYTSVCRACFYHSDTLPPMDYCDCECADGGNGSAWIRVVTINPIITNPNGRSGMTAPCNTMGMWAITYQIGVYRCITARPEVINGEAYTPQCEDITNDAILLQADAAAMRRTVTCCEALYPPHGEWRIQAGAWVPIGPSGGCAGGALSFTVQKRGI